ncbi:glycerate kinase type-2 family protein [Sporolactobacillus laevolacticus]|uniref:Hydroxypyruvate reductase n=1 Tax=Sporolactobacillus laevolacticus DSM 442 TaxID=1395513 RepID=V6IVZ5_9BACL|nr:DUF4147 domain-containing protein [Sporolactobacillus laevolacticus]EST11340.1 hydroxypyruvate reductase [Sporolactobacillus laevolacticus DSM 442]
MGKIRNYDDLISHGYSHSRKIILDIVNRTLDELDAYSRMKQIIHLEDDTLIIGEKKWDLSQKKNIYLIGAGKACNAMAKAIDEILGDKLTKGIIIVKVLEKTDVYNKTEVYVGGHPLPNHEGYLASKKILQLVDSADSDDLFLAVVSGGSSSLMSCPIDGITLEDEKVTTDIMLKSGAGIYEINAIRRHISQMNGGMLAKRIQEKGAELIGFGISDAVGNPPTQNIRIPYKNYSSTPIGPDKTTFEDAQHVIQKYNVQDRLPKSVVDYLMNAGPEKETPKEFPDNTYYLINTLPDSGIYAKKISEELGIKAIILSSYLEGESKEAGIFFASIAKEIQEYGNPVKAPCIVISTGETTTEILDNRLIKGHGGPSQELTASFAASIAAVPGACMLSIDSEGTDGTTQVAGGITDATSMEQAKNKGVDLFSALRSHSCYEALSEIGDIVITGNTGTNVCDLNILYIPKKGEQL